MRFGGGRHQQQQNLSSSVRVLPKFQTAYSDIEDRKRSILTFDIEKIDSCSISLTTEDCVCIVGNERKYVNAILMRLCVRALMSKRQGGFESTNVIFIDAGNDSDVYQCVNFARQYGLSIKKVLQSIMITRAFTIYQLADLIIYQLPRIVQQFNTKVIVVISDLLNMFTQEHDPNIDHNEAIFLIKEIINSIKKTLDKTLVVVSFQQQHNNHKSYAEYDKILLPRFDKRIEITRNNNSINDSSNIKLLDVKIYNKSKNCSIPLLLEERDLLIIPDPK
jgi:hypothetical protein